MTFATSTSIAGMSPVERRAYALQVVINYAGTCKEKSRQFRTSAVFRNHFESLKMFELAKRLEVNFQRVIDDAIKTGAIRVTNGIVWVSK